MAMTHLPNVGHSEFTCQAAVEFVGCFAITLFPECRAITENSKETPCALVAGNDSSGIDEKEAAALG